MAFTGYAITKKLSDFAMEKGDEFVFNKIFRDVADQDTIRFLIKNTESGTKPADEKKFIIITNLIVSSEGKTTVENIKNVDIDTPGTVQDVDSQHTGYTKDAIAELQQEPSFSSGERLGTQLIGARQGPSRVGGKDGSGLSAFILHPGDGDLGNLAGEITNESGQAEDISVRVEWFEVAGRLLEGPQP